MKRQLVEEQNIQEVSALFRVVQVHALPNRTYRLVNAPDHTWTQIGVTLTHTPVYSKYIFLLIIHFKIFV